MYKYVNEVGYSNEELIMFRSQVKLEVTYFMILGIDVLSSTYSFI